jgi:hypothetical protein
MKQTPSKASDILIDLMEHSEYGPVAKFFVFNAVLKFAEAAAVAPLEDLDQNSLIRPEIWQGVARDRRKTQHVHAR